VPSEADTCRKFVVPLLQAAGWDAEPYSIAEQRTITDGRIVPVEPTEKQLSAVEAAAN
jgi:type I restriction enzyme R subunit